LASRLQQLGAAFETLPGTPQLARHALPHRDHEARGDEDADLAEVDLLAAVVVPRRAQDDQPDVALVLLDLGPEVEGLGVLDGEDMEAEAVADLLELLGGRLEHPEPDEPTPAALGGGLLELHRALVLPAA